MSKGTAETRLTLNNKSGRKARRKKNIGRRRNNANFSTFQALDLSD